MNIFRLIADALHLLSIIILLLKIRKTRSAAGISFKSQLLYFLVFLLRYLDLFTRFLSFYNSAMKIFFLISSGYVVYLMKKKFKATWDPTLDTFHAEFLVIGAALIGIVLASKYTLLEIAWSISIWLEAVAIVPQFFQLQRTGEAETITTHYLFALGAYRGFYILNWIYRYFAEGHLEIAPLIAGIIQTLIYADFFYIYFTRVLRGKKFELPH